MFRKKKDKKGDEDVPDAPNINDDDDAMWFKPKSSSTAGPGVDIALPGMGIPPPAPPTGIRMSISPNLSSVRKSPSNSFSRKRFSVNDVVAAINYQDWSALLKMIDEDPKVASKNAQVNLKGQMTESNPLLLLVVKEPPVSQNRIFRSCNFDFCVFDSFVSLLTKLPRSLSLSLASLIFPIGGSGGKSDKSLS